MSKLVKSWTEKFSKYIENKNETSRQQKIVTCTVCTYIYKTTSKPYRRRRNSLSRAPCPQGGERHLLEPNLQSARNSIRRERSSTNFSEYEQSKERVQEAERVLKIIVVYKTQIWQDEQSVYRNTNTIRKTIIERCYTINIYKLLCKRDSGEDGSDISPSLCLLKSHLVTIYLVYYIFFFVSYQSRTSTYQTTGTVTSS